MSRRPSGPVGLRFSETMAGHVAFGEHDHAVGTRSGRASGTRLTVHLLIEVEDLDRFWAHGRRRAKAAGSVHCEALGSGRPIERGSLDLFSDGPLDQLMRYRLFFRDAVGHPLTLVGSSLRASCGCTRSAFCGSSPRFGPAVRRLPGEWAQSASSTPSSWDTSCRCTAA